MNYVKVSVYSTRTRPARAHCCLLTEGKECAGQLLKLNMIYIVSVSACGIVFLPAGFFLDINN
jgi:hypothetical protein